MKIRPDSKGRRVPKPPHVGLDFCRQPKNLLLGDFISQASLYANNTVPFSDMSAGTKETRHSKTDTLMKSCKFTKTQTVKNGGQKLRNGLSVADRGYVAFCCELSRQ